jgi:hypothetical protein
MNFQFFINPNLIEADLKFETTLSDLYLSNDKL